MQRRGSPRQQGLCSLKDQGCLLFGLTDRKARLLAERMLQLGIREEDIQEQFVRAGGPGGQHVNKTSTCVLLRHVPTQITVKVQRSRSQMLNRYYARRRLCEILEESSIGKASPKAQALARVRKQKDRRRRRRLAKTNATMGISNRPNGPDGT